MTNGGHGPSHVSRFQTPDPGLRTGALTAPRLALRGVTICHRRIPAVERLDLDLAAGSFTGLLGPNGAGKSTLLQGLLGWLPLAAGTIALDGGPRRTGPRLAYLAQQPSSLAGPPQTVHGLVVQGRYPARGPWGGFRPEDRAVVDQAITELGLEHLRDRPVESLSGGERQRAYLARTWATGAEVVLLDEPLAGLDPAAAEEVMGHLRRWSDAGRTVLAVLHDPRLARRHCTRLVGLRRTLVGIADPTDPAAVEDLLQRTYAVPDRSRSTGRLPCAGPVRVVALAT